MFTHVDTVHDKLEINMHHLRGNAIPACPLSDIDENLFFLYIPKDVRSL